MTHITLWVYDVRELYGCTIRYVEVVPASGITPPAGGVRFGATKRPARDGSEIVVHVYHFVGIQMDYRIAAKITDSWYSNYMKTGRLVPEGGRGGVRDEC